MRSRLGIVGRLRTSTPSSVGGVGGSFFGFLPGLGLAGITHSFEATQTVLGRGQGSADISLPWAQRVGDDAIAEAITLGQRSAGCGGRTSERWEAREATF